MPDQSKHLRPADPAMDKYQAAWTSRRENTFVNNPALSEGDRIYLRGIQSTWKIKLRHLESEGFAYQLMLIWDYDRIWGSFNLGPYKGVLMVNHGPDREPSQPSPDDGHDGVMEPIYFDFTWRGTCTAMPDTLLNNPLITKGKIQFSSSRIGGFFEGMPGRGRGRQSLKTLEFEGHRERGPARVPRNIQSFIDEWNDMNVFDEEESIREPPATGLAAARATVPRLGQTKSKEEDDEEAEEEGEEEEEGEGEEDEEQEEDVNEDADDDDDDDDEDQEEVLRSFSGIYDVHSDTVSAEWPDRARFVAVRMHVDKEQNRVWGWFDMGICEGYWLMQTSMDDIRYGKDLTFGYSGRVDGTGKSVRGTGEVTLSRSLRIKGSFAGMYGAALEFEGRRRLMPSGISGRSVQSYRDGWKEYEEHLNRWGR